MIVVTGGAGFIGSNMVAALVDRGERVVVGDRLGHGDKWRNLGKHELADAVTPEALVDFLNDRKASIKAVVHMGAISDTTETDGDALMANNFQLSKDIWNICASQSIPLIYASSAATYGDGRHGFDDDASHDYLKQLRPLNGYGWSKHLFDRWVMRHLSDGGAHPPQWAGLKFFNVYGPNEYHKGGQASVAYHLFNQIGKGEPARLFQSHHPDYADGEQQRDFIWVGDCIEIMLWLLDQGTISGLFNVGTGKARSFADLARALFTAASEEQNIRYVPTPENIRDKYQYYTEAKMARLRDAGYDKPFTTLEDGVALYVRNFLATADPYR